MRVWQPIYPMWLSPALTYSFASLAAVERLIPAKAVSYDEQNGSLNDIVPCQQAGKDSDAEFVTNLVGKKPAVIAFVDGITAATVGAIAGSVVVLARRSLVDVPTVVIAVVAGLAILKIKKIQEPIIIAAAALLGLAIYPFVLA